MALNTYGIKMVGLKKASGATINSTRGYSQLSYDKVSGEVIETWHVGNPMTSWSEFRDRDIIHVCNTSIHMTMQEIADAIHHALHHLPQEEY